MLLPPRMLGVAPRWTPRSPQPCVVPSVSDWFQWIHLTLGQMSHFPAPRPSLNTPDTHQPWVLPPPCCLHPSCTLRPQPAGPCGMEGDPDPAAVSLPAGSASPRLKNQSDTSVTRNRWQDALGSGNTSRQPPSTKPPP